MLPVTSSATEPFSARIARLAARRWAGSLGIRFTARLSNGSYDTAARHFAGPPIELRACIAKLPILPIQLPQSHGSSNSLCSQAQVEMRGFEPLTSALQRRRSPS